MGSMLPSNQTERATSPSSGSAPTARPPPSVLPGPARSLARAPGLVSRRCAVPVRRVAGWSGSEHALVFLALRQDSDALWRCRVSKQRDTGPCVARWTMGRLLHVIRHDHRVGDGAGRRANARRSQIALRRVQSPSTRRCPSQSRSLKPSKPPMSKASSIATSSRRILKSAWPMRACNIRISDLTCGENSDTPPCGRLAWRVGTWVLAEPLVWCSWRSSWLFP